jgi:hypothetical protein
MHDDDWANGNGEGLAEGLAKLARATHGVVVAAQMGRVVDAWVV